MERPMRVCVCVCVFAHALHFMFISPGFLYFWAIVFFVTTTLVALLKQEKTAVFKEQNIIETYQQLYTIIKLPAVISLITILLTSKVRLLEFYCNFVFFQIVSDFDVESMFLMRRLHLIRSCAFPPLTVLSLRQVVLDVIQPPPVRSTSPSFPLHLHRHHSLAHIFFLSSQYHFNLLSCTFVDISPTFVVPLILSFLILSLRLHSSILTSKFPQHPTSSLVLSSLPKSQHRTPLLVLQLSCILPLDPRPQAYSSVTQNPDTIFQFLADLNTV